MSTDETTEFDYESYSKANAPDTSLLRRGQATRQRRRAAAKQRITIRLDDDIIEAFRGMAPDGRGYQALMNRALRDWLTAQGVKELLREDLKELLAAEFNAAAAPVNENEEPAPRPHSGAKLATGS